MGFVINGAAQRREVLELFDSYLKREQHNSQTAAWEKLSGSHPKSLRSFTEVLRLRYPRASKADLEAMRAFTASRAAHARKAEWARTMGDVQQLFGCLDADGSGGIDLGEFLEACDGVPGLPNVAALRGLFRSADTDGNGVLDPSEFGALAETAGLRDKFGAIVERRKEQLTGKWMVARRTVLGREAHLVM